MQVVWPVSYGLCKSYGFGDNPNVFECLLVIYYTRFLMSCSPHMDGLSALNRVIEPSCLPTALICSF